MSAIHYDEVLKKDLEIAEMIRRNQLSTYSGINLFRSKLFQDFVGPLLEEHEEIKAKLENCICGCGESGEPDESKVCVGDDECCHVDEERKVSHALKLKVEKLRLKVSELEKMLLS
jgi:hypothetical protein